MMSMPTCPFPVSSHAFFTHNRISSCPRGDLKRPCFHIDWPSKRPPKPVLLERACLPRLHGQLLQARTHLLRCIRGSFPAPFNKLDYPDSRDQVNAGAENCCSLSLSLSLSLSKAINTWTRHFAVLNTKTGVRIDARKVSLFPRPHHFVAFSSPPPSIPFTHTPRRRHEKIPRFTRTLS